MTRSKYISLEEARRTGNLHRFIKEHPSKADERFWPLMVAVATETVSKSGTSTRVCPSSYNETQIPSGISKDTCKKHEHESLESKASTEPKIPRCS